MPGPLEGIEVLDISRDLPGTYACMLLGDMGAEVTKVESPDGDPLRSEPSFRFWNRGRGSVAVSIESPHGRQVLERLIAASDVLVETFRPGEARELALDFDTVAPLNPGLVYCALPPFGETGPMADLPADDGVVSSFAGVYGDQGGEGQDPMFVYMPVVSYGAAFLATFAVASALYAREMSGYGQKVEAPWYAGAAAMQSGSIVAGPNVTYWARRNPSRFGANPAYSLYRCQDDWLFIACGNTVFWNKLCIALSMEHLVEDPRFEDAPWNIPIEHRQGLWTTIGETLKQKPRAHWLEYFSVYDVPCAPAEPRERFFDHPQVRHNQIFVEVDDPVLGKTIQMGLPVKFLGSPGAVGTPAPGIGENTGEVLARLGYTEPQIASMADLGVIRLG